MTHPSLEEQTVSTETIFQGKIIELQKLVVTLPNGRSATREVVRHPGAVAILAEPVKGELILVEQFRKAPEALLLEVPAGKLDKGEAPEHCAVRELQEETGLTANRVEPIFDFYTSPGFADERIFLYYTNDVVQGEQALDEDEFVHLHTVTRQDVSKLLSEGRIQDAKTLIALLWWMSRS